MSIKFPNPNNKEHGSNDNFEVRHRVEENVPNYLGWNEQENPNDCGPCMILNIARLLELDIPDNNIEEVRKTVNKARKDKNKQQHSRESWLQNSDINAYFENDTNVSLDKHYIHPQEREDEFKKLQNIIETDEWKFVYSTHGRHFRAVINDKSKKMYLLADSLSDNPKSISKQEMIDFLHEAAFSGKGDSSRQDHVVVGV